MLKHVKALMGLNRLIYSALITSPTQASLNITDDEVQLETNGIVRILKIKFNGNLKIYNNLPEGYYINITSNVIKIVNILGKKLKEGGVLFDFSGFLSVRDVEVTSFLGEKFKADINDTNKLAIVNFSETKFEDDSLILTQEGSQKVNSYMRNHIDDTTIRGLYSKKAFVNGYTGYYNYNPKTRSYMTGKGLTETSKPIFNPKLSIRNKRIQKSLRKTLRGIKNSTRLKTQRFEPKREIYKEKVESSLKTKTQKTKKGLGGKY